MTFSSKGNIKNILKKYRIRPSKRLGQNFLIDEGMVKKIVEAANLNSKDIVLEIGPGLGVLTQELAKKAKKVIAIEKDPEMVGILKETLKDLNNIEIVQEDILKIFNSQFLISNYKVVGNLPFYLTTPVIRQFLELTEAQPQLMVLAVQKEVGQRICAKPPRMSILAVSVQFYAKPKIISYISKKSFWPQPKVDSAVIKITPKKTLPRLNLDILLFFKIVKAGFSQPRKQLANNLSKGLKMEKKKAKIWLLKNNIKPTQRAETLSIKNWIKLTKSFRMKK